MTVAIAALALLLADTDRAGGYGGRPEGPAAERTRGTGVALEPIGRFRNPTYVTAAPGFPRMLFVTERKGRIVALRDGRRVGDPFLDISRQVTTKAIEQGLVGLAFPPDYRSSRRFYVQYVDREGDLRIDGFRRRTATFAPAASRRLVLKIRHVTGYSNHSGGQLLFRGRYLYAGIGDGADPGDPLNLAQNQLSLRGKILRFDPRPSRKGRPFRIPRLNPFVGLPGRDPIFSVGLRNPFRFSFQRIAEKPDRIVIADVGQGRYEEINVTSLATARGGNFGWDAFEGPFPYNAACGMLCPNAGTPDPGGTLPPVKTINHDDFCAVIGGFVVRDPALPSLRGRYVYGDYCSGRIRSLLPRLTAPAPGDRGAGVKLPEGRLGFASLTSFGLDASQRVYVTSGNGPVYRLGPQPNRPGPGE